MSARIDLTRTTVLESAKADRMKRLFAIVTSVGVGVVLSACQANVGSKLEVPKDASATCGAQCADIGLVLDSVVIMASNVGCVCRARGGTASAGASGGAGGMVAIMMQQQAQQAQQQQQYRH